MPNDKQDLELRIRVPRVSVFNADGELIESAAALRDEIIAAVAARLGIDPNRIKAQFI
jgi:hypothetical protein